MERPPSIPPSPKNVSSKSGRSTLPQVQIHVHKLDPEIVDNEPIVLEREEGKSSGVANRYPVATVIFFATTGFVSGYFLSVWTPGSEGQATKEALVMWIGLIGDLFLRALKCVVLPLVFINVVLSTVDMLKLGKAGKVVSYTVGFYMFTTLVAALVGVFTVICYKGFFIDVSSDIGEAEESDLEQVSLSDTIYDGVFIKLISKNIFADFVSSNFASIIFFAVVFAFAVQKATTHLHLTNQSTASHVVDLFRELEQILLEMINWILTITPIAVFSLVANAVGKQDDPATAFANVGFLLAATATGFAIHFLFVYCLLILVVTKSNPFWYYKHLVPAQLMAFASASSAATIPVTLKSAIASGQVAPFIGGFVIPLGATLNMDGGGIYFPLATIFLAVTSGLEDQITIASYVMLVIIATIGSAGTAPVPSASLVLIITAYNTIFNTTGTPETFSFILAIDWLLDRGRTILNITGDATVARIVSHLMVSEEDADDDSVEAEVRRSSLARLSRLTNPEGTSMRKSTSRGGQGGPSSGGGEML